MDRDGSWTQSCSVEGCHWLPILLAHMQPEGFMKRSAGFSLPLSILNSFYLFTKDESRCGSLLSKEAPTAFWNLIQLGFLTSSAL